MSLMKLAPETVRLRRVAKSYAAGEFSRLEYRAARREVIENFQPDSLGDDDTQRRSPEQVAHRGTMHEGVVLGAVPHG